MRRAGCAIVPLDDGGLSALVYVKATVTLWSKSPGARPAKILGEVV